MSGNADPRFPYPRYLRVPFIFWPDGTPEAPEWAEFKAKYPGWVEFRASLTSTSPPVLQAEPQLEPELMEQPHRKVRSRLEHNMKVPRVALAAAKAPDVLHKAHRASVAPAISGGASRADGAGKGVRLAQTFEESPVEEPLPVKSPPVPAEGVKPNPAPGGVPDVVAPKTESGPGLEPAPEVAPVPRPAPPVEPAPDEARVRGDVKGGLPEPEAAPSDPSAASVLDKLNRYTLNPKHLRGKEKAAWFEKALGFTRSNIGDLAKQIVFDEAKAVKTSVTQYGTKFNQTIEVVGANGKKLPVLTAWIKGEDGIVKLVTALPGK